MIKFGNGQLTDYQRNKLLGVGSGANWVHQQQVFPVEEERDSCENRQMGHSVAEVIRRSDLGQFANRNAGRPILPVCH